MFNLQKHNLIHHLKTQAPQVQTTIVNLVDPQTESPSNDENAASKDDSAASNDEDATSKADSTSSEDDDAASKAADHLC